MNTGFSVVLDDLSLQSVFCEHCDNKRWSDCFWRSCCEYHTRLEHTLSGSCRAGYCCPVFCKIALCCRDIRKSESDSSKRPELKLQALGKSPLTFYLRAIKSIADNDLSFLKAYLAQYPSYVDALLPYKPSCTYDTSATQHYSLLQIAVMEGNPEAVELILQHNVDLEKKPYPLLIACYQLFRGIPVNESEDRECRSKITHDIIAHLLKAGANPNILYTETAGKKLISSHTPLTYCVQSKSKDAVKLLLSHGAKPMPDVGKGKESAKISQQICCAYMGKGVSNANELLPVLIENGLDINAYYGGFQLIHVICGSQFSRTKLRVLINNGADINAKTKSNIYTALHLILITQFKSISLALIDELLTLKADFSVKCKLPAYYEEVFPKSLLHDLKGKRTYTAMDLLPDHLPQDIMFYVNDTADKVPAANKKPSLIGKFVSYLSGATISKEPDSGEPGRQQYPTPSRSKDGAHASYQEGSDLSSRPHHLNPDAVIPGVFEELPPPYSSLFPEEDENSLRPPKKNSWFSSKRNSKKK